MAECPICLEALGDYGDPFESLLTTLECGDTLEPPSTVCHTFHRACLNGWRKANPQNKQTCPTCRRQVHEEEFSTVREVQAAKHVVIAIPTEPRQPPTHTCRSCIVYSMFATFLCFFMMVVSGMFADLNS